ncbi:MAG: gluconeogenesis factor YvcK family protein, partial [Aeromonas veronii]
LPMSEFPTDLCAHMECGTQILGEVSIDQLATPPLSLGLMPEVQATREAVLALQQADMIILGPGSFLTSIMPPLLLAEIAQAINESSAMLVFVCNLVAENGPASQLNLMSQCRWLESRVGQGRLDAILAPQGAGDAGEWQGRVIEAELGELELPHRHDRLKLKLALDRIIQQLLNQR